MIVNLALGQRPGDHETLELVGALEDLHDLEQGPGSPACSSAYTTSPPTTRCTSTASNGSRAHFAVYAVEQYGKDEFPTQHLYGDTAGPDLRLITCGGDFDHAACHYVDNVVVSARLA